MTTTMALKLIKHSISSSEDPYGSDSASTKEEEKTIPFLRRLVDMLTENETVISFYPGSSKDGEVTLGRIVVHDRLKVEADVLPRYFNHSSFASLRRQLNYFSFTRMGKGRQRGATYCNEAVIVMDHILRLKRRSTVTPPRQTQTQLPQVVTTKRERSVSLTSSVDTNDNMRHQPTKKCKPTVVSPRASPVHTIEDDPQITLDLTVPSNRGNRSTYPLYNSNGPHQIGDADVLAGCRALLCFSQGVREIGV